jgi:hypothetical protein
MSMSRGIPIYNDSISRHRSPLMRPRPMTGSKNTVLCHGHAHTIHRMQPKPLYVSIGCMLDNIVPSQSGPRARRTALLLALRPCHGRRCDDGTSAAHSKCSPLLTPLRHNHTVSPLLPAHTHRQHPPLRLAGPAWAPGTTDCPSVGLLLGHTLPVYGHEYFPFHSRLCPAG